MERAARRRETRETKVLNEPVKKSCVDARVRRTALDQEVQGTTDLDLRVTVRVLVAIHRELAQTLEGKQAQLDLVDLNSRRRLQALGGDTIRHAGGQAAIELEERLEKEASDLG